MAERFDDIYTGPVYRKGFVPCFGIKSSGNPFE